MNARKQVRKAGRVISAISLAALLALPVVAGAQQDTVPKAPTKAEKAAAANKVIATVGKDKITEDSVFAPLAMMPPQFRARYETPEGRKKLVERSVQMSLLSQEARRLGIDKKDEIARRIKEMTDQFIVQELTKQEVMDKVVVTDADMQKYYNENKDSFKKEERVRVELIMFKAKDNETEQVKAQKKAQAEQALARIKGGAEFSAVAREVSEDERSKTRGGDIGTFTRGKRIDQFGEAMEQKAFSLQQGEVSDVFPGKDGFYIVKVTEKKPAEQETFDEAKSRIERTLKGDKQKAALDSYLEALKKRYPVKIIDESVK